MKCLDNKRYENKLEIGKEYKIRYKHNGCFLIEHETLGDCWLSEDRFEKITN